VEQLPGDLEGDEGLARARATSADAVPAVGHAAKPAPRRCPGNTGLKVSAPILEGYGLESVPPEILTAKVRPQSSSGVGRRIFRPRCPFHVHGIDA
jgi:hypothetical protein